MISNKAMHALVGNFWPWLIYPIVTGLGIYSYERWVDTDPQPVQNYYIEAPEGGGPYSPTQYGGGVTADPMGGGGSGLLAGIGGASLLALGVGGYLLLKD